MRSSPSFGRELSEQQIVLARFIRQFVLQMCGPDRAALIIKTKDLRECSLHSFTRQRISETFGENIFKVGMTRRLEPKDRVRELGDASVPFPFDIHMMISCEDAPALENALHRGLHKSRMNKANPRKEFFKADLQTIVKIAEQNKCKVEYVADVEALDLKRVSVSRWRQANKGAMIVGPLHLLLDVGLPILVGLTSIVFLTWFLFHLPPPSIPVSPPEF